MADSESINDFIIKDNITSSESSDNFEESNHSDSSTKSHIEYYNNDSEFETQDSKLLRENIMIQKTNRVLLRKLKKYKKINDDLKQKNSKLVDINLTLVEKVKEMRKDERHHKKDRIKIELDAT